MVGGNFLDAPEAKQSNLRIVLGVLSLNTSFPKSPATQVDHVFRYEGLLN